MASPNTGSIVQTLPTLTQAAAGFHDLRSLTIDQVLPSLTQAGTGTTTTWTDVVADIATAIDSTDGFATILETLLTDTAQAADTQSDQVTQFISDVVTALDSVIDTQEFTDLLADTAKASDDAPALWIDRLTDIAEASDSSATPVLETLLVDSATASDSYSSYIWTEVLLTDTAKASDDAPALWIDRLTDTAEANDTLLGDTRIVFELVVDIADALDTVVSFSGITDYVFDRALAIDSSVSVPSILFDGVIDTARAHDSAYSADPGALAWVVNLETGAPWFYTNFNFTSVVEQAGMLFGAAQDGLYLLQGDDDAGISIPSELKTGLLDFGSDFRKYIPNIYFGYTGGELEIDVETYDKPLPGLNNVYTYGLEQREASAPRNNRIKPGKGLVGRYWRFTVRNVVGTAYQVYNTIADVVESKRRL